MHNDIASKRQLVGEWLGAGSVNFFGMPFAGKDTQGKRLAQWLDAALISGGDILRHHEIPAPDKLALDRGDLLPVEDYLQLIPPYLARSDFAGKPLVLSAVGHRSGEAEAILETTTKTGHPTMAVVHLRIDEATARIRWRHLVDRDDRRGRLDDRLDILKHRLDEYQNKTLPVLDFYRQHELLIEIDGAGAPDEVETAILDALYQKITQDKS
jgi:adenylate kinase